MAINKVVYGNRTLIDLTGVTVTADKLLEGYTALDKSGTLITGTAPTVGGSVIAVNDVADSHGGTVRSITAVSLEGDTVSPSVLASGYTAHNAAGEAITGTLVPGVTPTGTLNITVNGTHDVTNYASAYVNVQSEGMNLQTKTNIEPTESSQTITADNGYDGLTSVQINAISSSYVGRGITRRSSSDITMTNNEVDIPTGYYANDVSYSVPFAETDSGSLYFHAGHGDLHVNFDVASAGYISGSQSISINNFTGNMNVMYDDVHITPTTSQQVAANYGTFAMGGQIIVDAMPTGSVTAPASISGTTATVTTGTNTLTLTKTVSVTPSVTTAGYVSSGTAGNSSISLTANVTTKAAATITPTTSNQTIAAGTYLTGTQTIAGDANLVGSNILSGTSIFGVVGTVTFQTIYSGSSAPSSSAGVNGDIYIQT